MIFRGLLGIFCTSPLLCAAQTPATFTPQPHESMDGAPRLSLSTPKKNATLSNRIVMTATETREKAAAATATKPVSEQGKSPKKSYNKADLLNNPKLLQRAMESVLASKNPQHIQLVLPLYQDMKGADPVLINYAKALIAHSESDYQTATQHYRSVLAAAPDLAAVRFDLAVALYNDKRYDSALQQFKRLRSEALPKPIAKAVDDGIQAIQKKDAWNFSFNAYYQQDSNFNDAPEKQQRGFGNGTLTFSPPESAHGVHIDLGASKRFNLRENFYAALRFQAGGDYYWDNRDYNDVRIRSAAALGRQDANFTVEVEPYVTRRFVDEQSYSRTLGAKFSFSYRVTPKWQLSTLHDLSAEDFDKLTHLNGGRQFNQLSAVYFRNTRQYFRAGVNYFASEAQTDKDSYNSTGFYLGWGQEWGKGISSHLMASASQRKHRGSDFFRIQRAERNYAATLSLWKRDWQLWGLTPRVVYSWKNTNSNHFYYDKSHENDVRLEISKEF